MTQCQKVEEKLSGYIDGELTQQQSQQIRIHIEGCETCQQIHSELLSLQKDIKTIHSDGGEEAALEKIMNDLGAKQTQQWGWMLVIIGSVLMMIYSLYGFIVDNGMTSFEKIMFSLLGIGGAMLFISVVRQRMIASKTDKYKDINL